MSVFTLQHQPRGYMEVILGPMFSGKTTRLINLYNDYCKNEPHNPPPIVINYYGDIRYNEAETHRLTSHNQETAPALFVATLWEAENLIEPSLFQHTPVILINEGQFFPDLVEKVVEWTDILHKTVHICALNGDYKRRPFFNISNILPHTDNIVFLTSVCSVCKGGAVFSYRLFTTEEKDEQICIGTENYIPLCRRCRDEAIKP